MQIEEVVWDTVKHDYTHFANDVITRRILFKLFSLFNRFCDPEEIPLRLPSKAGAFLLHKLEIEPELALNEGLTFEQFLQIVIQTYGENTVKSVNNLYSKLVRNVILQDRVKYRIVRKNDNPLTWKSLTGTPNHAKNIVINHRYLLIYDDDISDLDYIGQDFEPHGAVLHKISLAKAEIRSRKSNGIFNKHSSSLVIITGDALTTIELSFNVFKDEFKMYKWTDAVHQAVDMIDQGTDPLTKLYQTNDLRPNYFKYRQPMKSPLNPQLMKLTGSAVNMRSNLNKNKDRHASAPQLEDILQAKKLFIHRHESDSSSGISTDDESIKSNSNYGVVIQLHGDSTHTIVTRNE